MERGSWALSDVKRQAAHGPNLANRCHLVCTINVLKKDISSTLKSVLLCSEALTHGQDLLLSRSAQDFHYENRNFQILPASIFHFEKQEPTSASEDREDGITARLHRQSHFANKVFVTSG